MDEIEVLALPMYLNIKEEAHWPPAFNILIVAKPDSPENFESTIYMGQQKMNHHFKTLLKQDENLDAQIDEDVKEFQNSPYASIIKFVSKIQIVFDAQVNVEVYMIKQDDSTVSNDNEAD